MKSLATNDAVYRLQVYDQPDDWPRLSQRWRELETRDSRCGVFQTFTWLSHLWQLERGPSSRSLLVAVHSPDGRLAALAPMHSQRVLGPIGVRVLRFIGHGLSDYQDILLADDCDRDTALSLLADWFGLARRDHDVTELDHVPQGAHLLESHQRLLPETPGYATSVEGVASARYFKLPDDFAEYQASISKSRRTHYRQHWRILNTRHRVEVDVPGRGEDAEQDLAKMMQLHQARQNSRGNRGMFRDHHRVEVFTLLFKAMIDEGRARVWTLKLDGRAYASEAILTFNGTAIDYNGGWDDDPAMKQHGLRNLLLFKAFERACTQPDIQWFDLGIGDEPYKASFARLSRPIHKITCKRHGLRSRVYDLHERSLGLAYHSPLVQRLYFAMRPRSMRPTK
jgi:CelD/BcsL family acetyltransferase involved in cellulose biosynthesis